ncbi:Alginate lyase 2 [Purpureocillium lavendulum]|uniref:Alginate lyase 2 n=1 Tax=Purpureocillium lavendulum TaxID=1247861 RepID=A0AB34FLT0_9HYPO|nr:Alginate lyase 2 [Purpureocillium lavendulum]
MKFVQSSVCGQAAMLSLLATLGAALDPNCAPGGNFDLSKWTLQLPTGSPGKPDSIPGSQLQGCNGYHSDVFLTDKGTGAMVMKVSGSPSSTGCVTTPNSKHCRTELRESNPRSFDPTKSVNRLAADVKVTKHGGEICIGQIHIDDSISTKPVAELYYNSKGDLNMGVQQCRTCTQKRTYIDNVPSGQRLTYEIRYEGGKLSVNINGKGFKTLSTYDLNNPKSYFKAGNYNQGEGATEIQFFSLKTTHG